MARTKLSPEEKEQRKKYSEEEFSRHQAYEAQRAIKTLSLEASESLRRIEGFAEAYKTLFAIDHDKYASMRGNKGSVIFDLLQRIVENRISSREEHSVLEYKLRKLCFHFKNHARFEDAKGELPSSFFLILEHRWPRQLEEISSGWTSRQLMERGVNLMLHGLHNRVNENFYQWVKEESDRTHGKVDIRNFPKIDPSDDISRIIEFVEFPDIALIMTNVGLGSMTIMDFYGLKDAIRIISSVVEVQETNT